MDYLAGCVAKYRVFFLWPGSDNLNDPSFNGNKKTFAWYWQTKDDNITDAKWHKENDNWVWTGVIYVDDKEDGQPVTIAWRKKDIDDFAAFCYSYDGWLVLEIDCNIQKIKSDYNYMANMTFRNSVRKYLKFVDCLLKDKKYQLVPTTEQTPQ